MNRIFKISDFLGCTLIMIGTLLTAVDAIARYALNSPIPSGIEFVSMILAGTIACGLVPITVEGGHVQFSILEKRLKPLAKRVLLLFLGLAGLSLFGIMTWQGVVRAWDAWQRGEYWGMLKIPAYPAKFVFAIGCLLVCLIVAQKIAGLFRARGTNL